MMRLIISTGPPYRGMPCVWASGSADCDLRLGSGPENICVVVNDPGGSGRPRCALYTGLGPHRLRYAMGLLTRNINVLWLTVPSGPVYNGERYVLMLIAISGKGKLCMLCKAKRVIMGIKMRWKVLRVG